jgi:hypothetical protein
VYTTALYNCTLTSASLASLLSINHRTALMLTTSFPKGNGRGKKETF